MRVVPSLALFLSLYACAEGPREAAQMTCDLFEDTLCEGEARCRLVAGGQTRCVEPQSAPAQGCIPESCPPAHACVSVEGVLACRPICLLDGTQSCPLGGQCSYPVEGAPHLGVCSSPCRLADDCGFDATCAPSPATPYPICVGTGPAGVGDDCTDRRCNAGLACLRVTTPPRCYVLCERGSNDSCDGQGCPGAITSAESLGYCPLSDPDSP